ncbi:His-Xaa-Ser system protein HxsD [Morganella psychrotolerans]|uniref:His-Xaa-Ser system protein HxsD n=1 Tax=Morganella psychrotolerans TaxID=368603 RepID=A0A1B8HPG7_9GAMM|nr:His-Xaa-Ser system protein HxsD [Morganella psychrotolerans]OBU11283.1 His-Xaa-Ser system protein HxsD [Morganella psychrotolerans]
MAVISLNKNRYSENVIRQALYWLSAETKWSLSEEAMTFEVTLIDDETLFHFQQLLNDYILREQIDAKTKNIRESIINKVLLSLDARLSK